MQYNSIIVYIIVFEVSLNKLYLVTLCIMYMGYVIYITTYIINLRTQHQNTV